MVSQYYVVGPRKHSWFSIQPLSVECFENQILHYGMQIQGHDSKM